MNELMNAPGFARHLEILFRYVLQGFDLPKESLGELLTGTLKRDVKDFLMTTCEHLIQEGEQTGANRVLVRLLAKKYRADLDSLIPLLGRLSREQQDELIERILQSVTLEEIVLCLESACQN